MSSIVEIFHVGDTGKSTNLKNTGTIFFHQCPFEKMPLKLMDFCSHQTATNALFEWFRCEIKGATENGNFLS